MADGHVITLVGAAQRQDKNAAASKKDAKVAPNPPPSRRQKAAVLTVVQAQLQLYRGESAGGVYRGRAILPPGMQVKARELKAFLADSDADSRLQKAFADGGVEIRRRSPGRQRTGTGEHGEYYVDDQKVISAWRIAENDDMVTARRRDSIQATN